MTTEEQFKAAVNVIRNLPKNGPVQPSNNTMLKFYAFFKQATEGPNTAPKPAFWDLVKKAKWDAWTKLGDMERETAMKNYVDEFKIIVESVSNSNMETVNKGEVDSFYASVPMKDLELVIGPIIHKVRSRSNSPVHDASSINSDLPHENGIIENDRSKPEKTVVANGNIKPQVVNGHNGVYVNGTCNRSEEDDDEEDFFLDTIENSDQGSRTRLTDDRIYRNNAQLNYMNGYSNGFVEMDIATSQQISKVIISLQKDLEKVVKSVNLIEQRIGQLQTEIVMQKSSKWSLMTSQNIIPFVVLFTWPVLLQLLIIWFRRKK